jgi:N-acetylglucosaminyldiphosphoundecaprenol N-acetyl-beta-D-mannosaminyltransferase
VRAVAIRRIGGVRVVFEPVGAAAERIERLRAAFPERGHAAQVVTLNPLMYLCARRDAAVYAAVRNAELCVADGIGVALLSPAGRFSHAPGVELVEVLCRTVAAVGGSVFLYGAKPGVAERAGRVLETRTGVRVAGTRHGYRSDVEEVVHAVNSCRPDYVFVALSVAQQETWIHRCKHRLNAGVVMGVGGSLDVISGALRRAPPLFRRLGLEWYFRLLQEPRRARRMLGLPLACAVLALDALSSRHAGTER